MTIPLNENPLEPKGKHLNQEFLILMNKLGEEPVIILTLNNQHQDHQPLNLVWEGINPLKCSIHILIHNKCHTKACHKVLHKCNQCLTRPDLNPMDFDHNNNNSPLLKRWAMVQDLNLLLVIIMKDNV